jgi:glycosyltransferase involved in cell wall biosynthesis
MSKNIIFVCDHLNGGGAERINIELADEFINDGYSVTMLLLDGNEIGMKIPEKLNVIDLNIKFENSLFRSKGKYISDEQKKIISDLESKLNPILVVIGYAFGYWLTDYFFTKNIWLWVHGDLTNFNVSKRVKSKNIILYLNEYRRSEIEKKVFYKMFFNKNIIVVNSELIDFYNKFSNPNIVEFIPNGVSDTRFLNIDNDSKQYDAIFVGRLSPEKRPDIAIQAFLDSKLDGKMAIVGDGILKNDLVDLVESKSLEHRILFLGWKENPEYYIKKSKILILTSESEGFPLVISESIILDVPVVSYNSSSGIEYQLSSGQLYQGLVEQNNYQLLVDTIKKIYMHPYEITKIDKERLYMRNCFEKFKRITGLN